jgi:hypothetical protein
LRHARTFHDRGFLLPLPKICCLVMICISATELFAVVVIDGDQPVMVLPALVFSVRCWFMGFQTGILPFRVHGKQRPEPFGLGKQSVPRSRRTLLLAIGDFMPQELIFLNVPNIFPDRHDSDFVNATEGGHKCFVNCFACVTKF